MMFKEKLESYMALDWYPKHKYASSQKKGTSKKDLQNTFEKVKRRVMDNSQNVSSYVKFSKTNNMANAEGHFWNEK